MHVDGMIGVRDARCQMAKQSRPHTRMQGTTKTRHTPTAWGGSLGGFRFILEVRDTQDNEGETTANGVDSR